MLVDTFNQVKKIITTSKAELPLEVDIPTFYDKVDPSGIKEIVKIADIVIVMAYTRRSPQKVIESVKAELEAAIEANKAILIGLNARDFSAEAQLENLITETGNRLPQFPSFLGFSIHDFATYRTLAER
jgi:hypothetical protein